MMESEHNIAASGPGQILSVSALNRLARDVLERGLPLLWVAGEVSNLTRAASGHVYFSLKDEAAQVRCVMFRNRAQLLPFRVRDGERVEARALVTLYEARGDFQLNVETLRQSGAGVLYEAFARLRDRLEAEGLFAAEKRKPLPRFPRRIGVVTSLQAAALHDVLAALTRRSPQVPVVVVPAAVQGEGAAQQVAAAIALTGTLSNCDVVIVARGGGSIEDLWAFNEEVVARAIHDSRIPVITGIGHETDTTIADLVADQRAATPTAASELVSAGYDQARQQLPQIALALRRWSERAIETRMQQTDLLAHRLVHPGERLSKLGLELRNLERRLKSTLASRLERERAALVHMRLMLKGAQPGLEVRRRELAHAGLRLQAAVAAGLTARRIAAAALATNLAHLNPQSTLDRGYSVTRNARGEIVRSSRQLAVGETAHIAFAAGWAEAQIRDKGG